MSEGTPVDLATLSIPQLQQLQQQFEEEMQFLVRSFDQLNSVNSKFVDVKSSLEQLKSASVGKPILIPLTSSLYIPGTLADVKNVLVDIGTGYFVERTPEQAQEYAKRRIESLRQKMEMVQKAAANKRETLQLVSMVLQRKQQVAQQQPGPAPAPTPSA